MTHTFQQTKSMSPNRTGVKVQQVYDLMVSTGEAWTCKELGLALGVDITVEENLKDISNRCGYLLAKGLVERIAQGTYRVVEQTGQPSQEGSAMTMTEAGPGAATEAVDGQITCGICGAPARSPMGLASHMTRSHKNGKLPQDEVFERIGRACEALFPEGVPMSRIIEVAELQKVMAKAVTRR